MLLQAIVVAVLVAACAIYAAWTLMPAAARRRVATSVLRLPLPASLAAKMKRHSLAASGCACSGCDHGTAKAAPPAVQTIRFQPRPPR